MTSEAYKAWIDAMPIDDVRRRIERLEQKLADLHVLERLYTNRPHPDQAAAETPSHGAPETPGDAASENPGEASSEYTGDVI